MVILRLGNSTTSSILCQCSDLVSYFEWAQNIQGYYWAEDEVNQKLERVMKRAFEDVYTTAGNNSVNLRTGAYMLAISRVAEVTRLRGIFP